MKGIVSNVEETLRDSRGSLRKTRVIPLAFENTRIMKPERRNCDSVICSGIVSGDDAASGIGEV
jgi:ribosome biogenesis SPOUT family RNA methylase Rps3